MARKKAFNEAEVLEKAIEVFWEKGYHNTSYNDLVARMGINRASMYDTYGDKHQLFLKALDCYRSKNQAELDALLASDDSIRVKLDRLMTLAINESLNDPQVRGCMMVNAATELASYDPEIAQLTRENRRNVAQAFLLAIKDGMEKGEVSSDESPEALADFFFNTYLGIRVLVKMGSDAKSLNHVKQIALSKI